MNDPSHEPSRPAGTDPQSLYAAGKAALGAGANARARQVLADALAQLPGEPALGINLAVAELRLGAPERALATLDGVAERGRALAAWHDCRGHALYRLGRSGAAVAAFRAGFGDAPGAPASRDAFAKALEASGCLAEAIEVTRGLLADLDGADEASARNRAIVGNNLANLLLKAGRASEGVAAYRQAIAAYPAFPGIHANYLLALHYDPATSAQDLYAAHLDWARRYMDAVTAAARPPEPGRPGKRPLRVGVVSGKLSRSPILFMALAGLEALDPEAIELYVYALEAPSDDYTRRLAAAATAWRSLLDQSDDAAAERIRADGLDILVNAMGQAETRPGIAARKPAPVTVQWGGYDTSALANMDWFLTDPVATPPGDDAYCREPVYRLPAAYVVYTPPPEAPAVTAPPAATRGWVTFGCFNNPAKLNPEIARVWGDLLRRVPGSRLYLRGAAFGDAATRADLVARLVAAGIPEDRLSTAGSCDQATLLASYGDVDIALDPWPYSGGVTTLEALWMGVPVVTRPGPSFAGRHSATHLTHAGLADWVAGDWESYIAIAERWAAAPAALAELRAGLRARLASSPVGDGAGFARQLTEALLAMQRRAGAPEG